MPGAGRSTCRPGDGRHRRHGDLLPEVDDREEQGEELGHGSVLRRDRLGGWIRSFAIISMSFVMILTLNTDTDTGRCCTIQWVEYDLPSIVVPPLVPPHLTVTHQGVVWGDSSLKRKTVSLK